jgi:hypothetical protein
MKKELYVTYKYSMGYGSCIMEYENVTYNVIEEWKNLIEEAFDDVSHVMITNWKEIEKTEE